MLKPLLVNIEPNKIALKTRAGSVTYLELAEKAKLYTRYYHDFKATGVLIHSTDDVESISLFLGAMQAGVPAVFCPVDSGETYIKELESSFNLKSYKNLTLSTKDKIYLEPKTSDIFLGVLSSGSTGKPKLIWKDYQAWFSAFEHQSAVFGISANDTVFVLDALSYSANLNSALHALWQGCTLCFSSLKEASVWPILLEEWNITSIFMVPSHLSLLPSFTKGKSAMKSVISAGEKLKPALAQKLFDNFPNAKITEYYGAAELGHISYIQNQDILDKPYSVGKPFPGVKIELKEKQVWVKSLYISPDYRDNATVLDLAELTEDGYLILLGRSGGFLNKRGLNIFAQEIEQAAEIFPGITKAVVEADKNNKIILFVESSKVVNKLDLKLFLESKLGKNKLPHFIYAVREIPLNASGKVNHKELRKIPDS